MKIMRHIGPDIECDIHVICLLRHVAQNSAGGPLSEIAIDAGYADQSHMGRAVRRATGFSPARLNRAIENEEAFWCYRLFGERF